MPNLIIKRSSEYVNALRKINIYIDGEKAGNVANGEEKTFYIPTGKHIVMAKIDWCSSKEISFYAFDNDMVQMKLSGFKNSKPFFLIVGLLMVSQALLGIILKRHFFEPYLALIGVYMLYYITIGRKRYLTLELTDNLYATD